MNLNESVARIAALETLVLELIALLAKSRALTLDEIETLKGRIEGKANNPIHPVFSRYWQEDIDRLTNPDRSAGDAITNMKREHARGMECREIFGPVDPSVE
ncbi:MAG: hypothetical protein P0Y66_22300 [Candidatus Kaistia colombiensis]|nr:MAG: hypothetical protein P0Y66_22300 [Kaistia sp.]